LISDSMQQSVPSWT